MTILVGPSKKSFTCQRVLLGYFSEFFDAACYGEFIEAKKQLIEMPEETEEQMETIIGWIYTGQLESTLGAGEVWAVAEKLGIPGLANEAMYFLFDYCRQQWIRAAHARFAYENTSKGSMLRKFMRDLVITNGPLSAAADRYFEEQASEFKEEWHSLIKDGGDFVLDIATADSCFSNHVQPDNKRCPFHYENHDDYLLPITTRPIEDFVAGKKRAGTRKRKSFQVSKE
jgi:hypothetical protein